MADSHRPPYPQLSARQCERIAIAAQRADFERQPPERQVETRDRVRTLLNDERRRGQISPSWLMLHAEEIYGVAVAGVSDAAER